MNHTLRMRADTWKHPVPSIRKECRLTAHTRLALCQESQVTLKWSTHHHSCNPPTPNKPCLLPLTRKLSQPTQNCDEFWANSFLRQLKDKGTPSFANKGQVGRGQLETTSESSSVHTYKPLPWCRSTCEVQTVMWVQIPPGAAHFFFEKERKWAVSGGVVVVPCFVIVSHHVHVFRGV